MATSSYIDAGKLDKPVQVLEFRETSDGVWEWKTVRWTWANIQLQDKSNLFSTVGIGARDAAVIMRRQPLTLHNALNWGGQHLFLTAITERGRNHFDAKAAMVSPVDCLATRTETTLGEGNRPASSETLRVSFPGVLTEKYVRYERDETHAESDISYVLVVPKAIALKPGDLVTVLEGPAKALYNVTICHVLDAFKSEYEIVRRGDV